MALINCPECKNEVSDKAEKLNNREINIIGINRMINK